jgi:hypothetical protein
MAHQLLLTIPLPVLIPYTVFVLVLIPIYWKHYGPQNFLWFSDIALFGSLIALWTESSLIASMMAIGVLFPELAWNVDYFSRLLTGKKLIGLSDYMFEDDKPLFLRALSLFHVAIPIILIWMLFEYGYSESAIFYQTILAWIVLTICYLFTSPMENINWVFGPGGKPQKRMPPLLYFFIILLFFPLIIFLPSHFLFQWFFNN